MKYLTVLFFFCCSTRLFAQTATYSLFNPSNGSSSNISVRQTDDQIDVNVLADWKNKTGKYGEFTGSGVMVNRKCTIKTDSTACRIRMEFSDRQLDVEFDDCMDYLLPEDFSGIYTKIADYIPGEYTVTSDISFFYSKPNGKARKKGFSSKAQVLNIEQLFKGDWGFATLMFKGKQSFGYVKMSDLKFRKTYLYD